MAVSQHRRRALSAVLFFVLQSISTTDGWISSPESRLHQAGIVRSGLSLQANSPPSSSDDGTETAATATSTATSTKKISDRVRARDIVLPQGDSDDEYWNQRYQELVAFIEENGHALVPLEGSELGNWVRMQRRHYKDNKMSESRRQKLELVGFVWNVAERRWLDKYEVLVRFVEEEGHARVPHSHYLSQWVQNQRMKYKKGKLSEERYQKLMEVDFCWDVADWNFRHHVEWVRNETLNGKEIYDLKVPDGPLGLWMSHQKREYRKYRNNQTHALTISQIELLEDVGFSFDMIDTNYTRDPRSNEWSERMEELWRFKEEHGHTNVPRTHPTLGAWVTKVRERMDPWILTKSDMEVEIWRRQNRHWERDWQRLLDLREVGFIWDVYEWRWQNKFRELLEYRQEHGHCNVPFQKGGSLGTWVREQRAEFLKIREGKASRMTMQRARALSRIGFEFVRRDSVRKQQSATFQKRIDQYNDWKARNLPKSKMGKSLRYWTEAQRKHYRKWLQGDKIPGTFDEERRKMLESSGIVDDLMMEEDSG